MVVDGDGDDLTTELGKHGDEPREWIGGLCVLALVDNGEHAESV